MEKVNELLKSYNEKLERKLRAIQPFLNKKNSNFDYNSGMNEKEHLEWKTLEVEINMLRTIIEDLKYVVE